MKILVVGSSNIDYVISSPSIPKPGETVIGNGVVKKPGGKGANQAVAVSKLGGEVTFLSALGCHGDESILYDMFNLSKLSVNKLRICNEANTGCAYITVDSTGQNSIVVIPGANDYCDADYLQKCDDAFKDADIILLCMEIPFESVEYTIKRAKKLNKKVVLNPAPAPDFFNEELFSSIDILTPNETELEKLSGLPVSNINEVETAAKSLLRKGLNSIIVTIGSKGALYISSNKVELFSSPKVKVKDTTAAGDTFNGALCVYLAENHSIEESIEFANVAASISVSRDGAQTSIPFRNEIEEFINRGDVVK